MEIQHKTPFRFPEAHIKSRHLDGSGNITMVGGSNYHGGSNAVDGGSLYIDGGHVTLIGGNKIVGSYGHVFKGKALNYLQNKPVYAPMHCHKFHIVT